MLNFDYHPEEEILSGFSDSDYAGNETSKSTSGFVFFSAGSPIAWATRRQTTTALSTSEAELIALSEAAREAAWLRKIFSEISGQAPATITLYEDNQTTTRFANNLMQYYTRVRHLDTKYFYVCERVTDKTINVEWIATTDMIADIFTKPMARVRFKYLLQLLFKYQHAF